MRTLILLTVLAAHAAAQAPAAKPMPRDQWLAKPVDDRTFASFKTFYQYDASLPLDVKLQERDTSNGVAVQHLTYQSTVGVYVPARAYSLIAGRNAGRPAILLLHGGNARGKDQMMFRVQSDFLAKAGFLVLAIDMQYYGERATDLLTTFSTEEKHDRLYNQKATYLGFVMQTIKDAGRAFDVLVANFGADPKRIVLVGVSRGAIVGSIVAGADHRFAAAALLLIGHGDVGELEHEAAACPANYLGRIWPRPVYFLSSTSDAIMLQHEAVEPLQKLAKEPKQVVWLPSGHTVPNEALGPMATWLHVKLR